MESDYMKNIEFKKGSALSIVVTIFVMIALLSAFMIVLLKQEIIYINPDYIRASNDNEEVKNNDDTTNNEQIVDLTKYEGIVNGIKLKQLLQDIGNNNITNVIVYISENFVNEVEATKDNANTIIMTNARITNSTEYTKIIEESNYKVICEKNLVNVVEKIYVIKINNDI